MPDEHVAVHVDVDTVIESVKVQRKRRRAVGATVLATAALVAGLVVATGQLDRDTATPAAQPGVWTVQTMDIKDAALSGVAPISQSDVWVVGYQRGPNQGGLAMHWDGTLWKRFDVPTGYALSDVAAIAPNDVWAVGDSNTRDGDGTSGRKPVAAHWDGTSWKEVPVPAKGRESVLSAVAAISADDVWAVGHTDGSSRPFILHWDGRDWQEVTTPAVPGAKGMMLRDITAIAADDIWAVGVSDAGGGERPLSLHWDGHEWSVIPVTEDAGNLFNVTALGPDDVWASAGMGFFHWDGGRWQSVPLPAELNGYFVDLGTDGAGGLLATGNSMSEKPDKEKPDKGQRLIVARWNGTEWALIKPPVEGKVFIGDVRATPGSGVIWTTGEIYRASSGVDVTGKPVTEEPVAIVATISFGP